MSQPSPSEAPVSDPTPRPLLQQAPVVPLDASGLMASLVGTALFAICTIVCWLVSGWGQWADIMALTTVVGGVLIAYTAWHRAWVRRRAGGTEGDLAGGTGAAPPDDPET